MRFEHALASHLAQRGVPVLPPVVLWGSDTWMKVGDFYAEVYPFVAGRQGRATAEDARLSGAVLARFHGEALSMDRGLYEPPEVQNQMGAPEVLSLLQKLDSSATCGEPPGPLPAVAHSTLDRARSRLSELHARGGATLPVTIRHGDPHVYNFIYSEEGPGRVRALLDLDMAAEGPRIFDVSYALYFLIESTAWVCDDPASPDGAWRHLCQEFVRGYAESADTAVGPAEASIVCPQMQCIAAHFLYWDIVRTTKPEELSGMCEQYRSKADWLSAQGAEVSAVVAAA